MKVLDELSVQVSQAEFALIVGVSEAAVSGLVAEGTLVRGETVQQWLHSYCRRLREVAAGRMSGELGGLDLVQERAALARTQREGLEIKNAVARKEYAPIDLLAAVLAAASQAISERFDELPGKLAKEVPDLPDEARTVVMTVIANARNEWVKKTSELVVADETSPDDDLDTVDLAEAV